MVGDTLAIKLLCPNFSLLSGKEFDFHGGCDLVLLQNPSFSNGLGLNVHVRTRSVMEGFPPPTPMPPYSTFPLSAASRPGGAISSLL